MKTHMSSAPNSTAKAPTGIVGFDEITMGGLPRGRATLLLGGPGSGKTILALQTLVNGARLQRESGIFVAFEESSRRIIANAASFGWDLPALQRQKLFFLDAQPRTDLIRSGSFDLQGLLAALRAKARQMRARRIVFDSVDVPLALLADATAERREIYSLHEWLLRQELTALITAKLPADGSSLAFVPYMVDCAVELNHVCPEGVSQRNLRVLKYRGTAFAENAAPFVIGPQGLEVASLRPASARSAPVTTERVSSGVARLDTMLGGGYYRGAGILITGSPGTAKTTLCGAFVDAACRRGERTLFVSFDSKPDEIIRNLASVNLRLGGWVRKGRLRLESARSVACSAEIHFLNLKSLAREHRARCVVVDPVSALSKTGSIATTHGVVERLADWAKHAGITLLCTSLLDDAGPDHEGTPLQISTIADTWIHLSYVIHAGERNRALTIIKSRGTAHSNQVRELILLKSGVSLSDVFTAGGEVLMGTLRWEKEQAQLAEQKRQQAETARRQAELAATEANLEGRIQTLQLELSTLRAERQRLGRVESARRVKVSEGHTQLRELRGADADQRRRPRRSGS
jgi:circadian clock protein KaiC